SKELSEAVIVQNKPGATGTIGAASVARSKPDGHTILLAVSASYIIAPMLLDNLPYDPQSAFKPLGRLTVGGLVILVRPEFPANDIQGLIEYAKKSQTPITYGSWGHGSGGHLVMAAIAEKAGIEMLHVPYKGATPMLQDLIGTRITVAPSAISSGETLVESGQLKAIAVTATQRSSKFPELPTLTEQKLDFAADNWIAIFAPKDVPDDVTNTLRQALAKVMENPETLGKIK